MIRNVYFALLFVILSTKVFASNPVFRLYFVANQVSHFYGYYIGERKFLLDSFDSDDSFIMLTFIESLEDDDGGEGAFLRQFILDTDLVKNHRSEFANHEPTHINSFLFDLYAAIGRSKGLQLAKNMLSEEDIQQLYDDSPPDGGLIIPFSNLLLKQSEEEPSSKKTKP